MKPQKETQKNSVVQFVLETIAGNYTQMPKHVLFNIYAPWESRDAGSVCIPILSLQFRSNDRTRVFNIYVPSVRVYSIETIVVHSLLPHFHSNSRARVYQNPRVLIETMRRPCMQTHWQWFKYENYHHFPLYAVRLTHRRHISCDFFLFSTRTISLFPPLQWRLSI